MTISRTWRLMAAALLLLPAYAWGQSSPNLQYGQVPSAAQWNSYFAAKQDYSTGPLGITRGGTGASTAGAARASLGLAIGSNVEAWFPNLDALGNLAGTAGKVPVFTGAGSMSLLSDITTIGGLGCPLGGSCVPAFSNIAGTATTAQTPAGKSVADPGTGQLESLTPFQTVTGASKVFATSDLQYETRRSNAGSAMSDTFPAAAAAGMANGAQITLANIDTTATDTLNAGTGTMFSSAGGTSPTTTVGPGRAVRYIYDSAGAVWRPTLNTGTVLLGPNNLSDLSSAATARSNLGLGTAATKNSTAASGNIVSASGSFTIGHVLTAADTSGTAQDGGAVPAGTITGVTAGTGLSGGGTSGNVTLTLGTVTSLNGVAYPASPATNKVPVVTAGNTITYETVPVAAGGTNCVTAGGTCLDNILGLSTTGIVQRTGTGTYTIGTSVSGLTLTGSSFQGPTITGAGIIDGSTALASAIGGPGAGTGASVTSTGSKNLSGVLSVTTGSTPSASSGVVTVTFGTAYAAAPKCFLQAANQVTSSLTGTSSVFPSQSTTAMQINSGSSALAASTTYSWSYECIQ